MHETINIMKLSINHEAINICLNYLFPDDDSNVLGLTRKLFKTLLEKTLF